MRVGHFLRAAVWLVLVLGLPFAAVGLGVAKGHAQTQIANPFLRFLAVVGLFLVLWGIVVLSSFLHHIVVNVVTFLSLAVAVTSAGTAVELTHLQRHGRTTSCAVLKIDKRVETSFFYDGQGNRTTTTTTHYDHQLDCVDGGRIDLTLKHEIAPRGYRLDLTFDPDGHLDPIPAVEVEERDTKRSRAAFFLVVTLLVRFVDFVVTVFSPTASSARLWSRAAPAGRTTPPPAATPPGRRAAGRGGAARHRADRR